MADSSAKVVDVADWEARSHDGGYQFKPSETVLGRQLWVTLLAAVLIVIVLLIAGFPPGCRAVSRQQDRVDQLATAVDRLEQRADRMRTGVTQTTRRMSDQAREQADRLRADLQREQARLANTHATLGPVGDAIYWSVVGLLLLVGVGAPAAVIWTRESLQLDDGAIVLRRNWPPRKVAIPAHEVAGLGVIVQRMVRRTGRGRAAYVADWLWTIVVAPGDSGQPELHLRRELSSTLPTRVEDLTLQVRPIVRWLESATGQTCAPPVVLETSNATPGGLRPSWRRTVRRAGPAQTDAPHKPLDA